MIFIFHFVIFLMCLRGYLRRYTPSHKAINKSLIIDDRNTFNYLFHLLQFSTIKMEADDCK